MPDENAPDISAAMPQPDPSTMSAGVGQPSPAQPSLAPQGMAKGTPALIQYIRNLVKPPMQAQPGQMARPQSRADLTENFLGNFLFALGQGFQNAGHGPGANLRGFGAAVQAPIARQQLQQQMAQQAAETQQKQAQAQMTQAGTQPVTVDIGNGPQQIPAAYMPTIYRGAGAAQISGQYGLQKQGLANQGKINAIQAQTKIMAGEASKFIPDTDSQGQQFYHVMNKFGKEIAQTDVNVIPSLMSRTSDTVSYQTDADGNIIALPKKTVSGPNIPGRGAQFPRPADQGNVPRVGPGAGPRVVAQGKVPELSIGMTPDGKQVAGTFSQLKQIGATGITKAPANMQQQIQTARSLTENGGLFDMVERDLQKFKPEELNGLGNRWQEFLTGTFGADDRYVALRTHLNGLTGTAVMQAHVGSKGGNDMMEHFQGLADAGKFTFNNLKAATGAEREYIEHRAMRVPTGSQGGGKSMKALDPLGIR